MTLRGLPGRALALVESPARFALLIAAVLTIQIALRLLMMAAASQDDAEQLILAQGLAAGYAPEQPPLYTWLVVAAQALFGPGLLAVLVVKLLCQLATFGFCYLAARRALGEHRLAALATGGLFAVYYVAWESLYAYSHTALLAAAIAATGHALLRLRDAPTMGAYVWLGLAVGVGLLAKYGYGVFLAGLAAASLAEPAFRQALMDRRLAATLGAALVVVAPHALWLAGGAVDPAAVVQSRLTVAADWGWWGGLGNALAKLANALVSFYFPLWLILLAAFPRAFWQRLPAPPLARHDSEPQPARRLLALSSLAMLAVIVASFLALGVTTFRTHYAVIFLLAPLWVFLRVQALAPDARALGRYALAVVAAAVVFVVGVPVKALVEPQMCSNCYYNMPYADLAAEMREAGFRGGTIIAHFHRIQLGGNLKAVFPDSRVVDTKYPFAVPAAPADARQCMLVWDPRASEAPPEALLTFARDAVGARLPDVLETHAAEARLAWARQRTARLAFAIINDGC